jgi:hypothetical protein
MSILLFDKLQSPTAFAAGDFAIKNSDTAQTAFRRL